MNKLDNQTTGKAIDALLNFETVALFNNQVATHPVSVDWVVTFVLECPLCPAPQPGVMFSIPCT